MHSIRSADLHVSPCTIKMHADSLVLSNIHNIPIGRIYSTIKNVTPYPAYVLLANERSQRNLEIYCDTL